LIDDRNEIQGPAASRWHDERELRRVGECVDDMVQAPKVVEEAKFCLPQEVELHPTDRHGCREVRDEHSAGERWSIRGNRVAAAPRKTPHAAEPLDVQAGTGELKIDVVTDSVLAHVDRHFGDVNDWNWIGVSGRHPDSRQHRDR